MIKITEYTISQFDFDLINHIKTLRIEKKISQEQLSISMGLARSFVGNVENINESHKYSTRHLTLLAKAFEYENISAMMKFPTPEFDKIKVTVKQTMNESGTKALSSEVVKIEEVKKVE